MARAAGGKKAAPKAASADASTIAPPTATRVILPSVDNSSTVASDPKLLLDAFDAFASSSMRQAKSQSRSQSQSQAQAASAGATLVTMPPHTQQPHQSASIDPIAFLNKYYKTEAMLVAMLPDIQQAVAERMDRLDDRITGALQRQSETAEATQKHVQDAKVSVVSLEQRIRQVKHKASQSEKAVREITKDMKRLDCAKRHLQRTITSLKQLHMLIHAVEQLRLSCLQRPYPDYRNAANLVDATRLLLNYFEAYTNKVEPMRLLSQKITDLQVQLRLELIHGFRLVAFGPARTAELEEAEQKLAKKKGIKSFPTRVVLSDDREGGDEQKVQAAEDNNDDGANNMTPDVMAGGALMIDALGDTVRRDFIRTFAQDHLSEYRKLFQPSSKKQVKEQKIVSSFKPQPEAPPPPKTDACLELIDKRFAWFRALLQNLQQTYPQVFPLYWNLQYSVTVLFLQYTRNHILALLRGGPTKDPDSSNATILLKALQKTLLFEKEMMAVLQRDYSVTFVDPNEKEEAAASAPNMKAPPQPPSVASVVPKTKLPGAAGAASSKSPKDDGKATTEHLPVKPLFGIASCAYDNHMGPYIALEESSMDEQLVEALEDRTVDTRGELPVFTTSTKLFVYIKGSITRCTALTKGNAFFLLHQAFQDSLQKFAQVLSSKLPPPVTQSNSVGGLNLANVQFGKQEATPSQAASYKVPKGEEVTVCQVIATCEYCADTVEALEDLIRDTIDEPFKSKIDMMNQQEAFHEITAKSIRVLVSGLENRLEDALKMMSSVNWGAFDEVGEESDYVRYMHKEIQPYVTTARGNIPTVYFRSFCDKFAMLFTQTYYDSLIRLKRISEAGTQQLLLDVYNLKTLFLKLPVLETAAASAMRGKSMPAGSTIAPAMYTKMVQKQFKRVETLLKLTGTPTDMLIDVFRVQWVGGSALDLQTVMSLKGIKRTDQASMLEKFGLDPVTALKGATVNVTSATIVSERFQAVQDQASKVNHDFSSMKINFDKFRKNFT